MLLSVLAGSLLFAGPAAVYDCPKLAVKTPVSVIPVPPPPKS